MDVYLNKHYDWFVCDCAEVDQSLKFLHGYAYKKKIIFVCLLGSFSFIFFNQMT